MSQTKVSVKDWGNGRGGPREGQLRSHESHAAKSIWNIPTLNPRGTEMKI